MTTAKTIPNIILEDGKANELTIFTESCEKVISKQLTSITPPQSSANFGSGPKDTKIVDLLRIDTLFIVRGTIESSNETKFEAIMDAGGVFTFTWKGTVFDVNFQKISITNDNKTENDETSVLFTVLKGVDI